MVNKRYLLLAGLCSAMALQPAMAQESATAVTDMTYRGKNYDFLDSSYFSGKKKMTQYRQYMNHESFYPPKPNNQWEVGVNFGLMNVFGDVTSKLPWNATKAGDAMGFGFTVRKSLGYYLSARFQFMHGRATGMDYRVRNSDFYPYIVDENPLNPDNLYYPGDKPNAPLGRGADNIYVNYRTTFTELSLQLVGAINNINFHKAKNALSLYAFIGPGVNIWNTKLNMTNDNKLDANGKPSSYKTEFDQVWAWQTATGKWNYADRKDINDKLEAIFDDSYETIAKRDSHSGSRSKGNQSVPALVGGMGIQYRLSKLMTLSLEDKVTMTWRDGLDGVTTWKKLPTSDKDVLNYFSVGLGFNIGNAKKNVAPLWWVNPLDVAYAELSAPRHMKVPPAKMNDADGDGVVDQMDKCPDTPAGVTVDTHGCPLDTDGDGVPDYRDKQLITPTECQPVDADGVGKCPCPDGCGGAVACSNISAGSLNFAGTSARITPGMQAQLSNLAAQMSANPTCKVVISGAGNTSKVQQQRSWDRVNSVIEYMSEKHGVDRNRFIFKYGEAGNPESVMFRSALSGEEGPSNVAPPFPNLRKN